MGNNKYQLNLIDLSQLSIFFFKQQSMQMKTIDNQQKQLNWQQEQHLIKKLTELQNLNKEKETLIQQYQSQIKSIEQQNHSLDQQIEIHQREWQEVQQKMEEQKESSQDQEEMHQWIENVQKHNGLPQQAIESLCSMEFEGDEQEICLSCYQQLHQGALCTYLPCAHLFHKECIANHLKVNKMCPACQEIVQI